jgi:hypothetical protein
MTEEHKNNGKPEPFLIRGCTLVVLSTGISAQNLRELRAGLEQAPADSIYHHFWGRFLQAHFDEPQFNNDFASWVRHVLREKESAERLSVINPADFDDLEGLRAELIDVIETALDEQEMVPWARFDQQFHFLRSQIIVFDTGLDASDPAELARLIPTMSPGMIFYHFIDARRRTPDRTDDFSHWIESFGPKWTPLVELLRAIDPYFSSLADIRKELAEACRRHMTGMLG